MTTANGSLYVANMRELWKCDARLAMAIESIHPLDIPHVEPTKDNHFTVKLHNLYVHSRYRPQQEADSWAASQKCDDKYVVIVNGFGLGYHVKALFARMPGDALLVIAEPNVALLRAAMETVDLSEMLASRRIFFFTSLDRGDLVNRLEPRSVMFTAGGGTLFASHPVSMQIAGEFHSAFQKMITEFVAFTRIGFVTLMLNNVTTCRNIANNLGRFATTPPIDTMHNAFAGMPAVLVAAGPSLQKNMHLLKELLGEEEKTETRRHEGTKDHEEKTQNTKHKTQNPGGGDGIAPRRGRKAVIIAVQTMLKPLLAAGIEPDFVTSLDYNTVSTRFFENLEESGSTGRVHLVAEAKANWNVLDVFTGSMSLLQNDFADKLLRDAFPSRMGLKAGATVAHLSFYLAEFLGCNPIILTGQDLGFVDGLYYKPGTAIHETWGVELGRFNNLETKEWERIARSRHILRKIPDIHGHPMYTEEQFFVYLQQFERDFAESRHQIIDATEGGARKQHVTVMTLREAIDKCCNSEFRVQNSELAAWKTWSCDADQNLRKVIAALEVRRQSAADMIETCDATVPLLEQMIESQTDEQKMNRLFVEVDRLRSRVGNDPATFEMVCNLNTIGELRRFQADLGVKSVKDNSLERQKRQLLRDIDYVQNLKTGAERLLEILDEALTRLHRQLEAIKQNKPWPREVAGALKG
ncbi:MAG TPA: 6-hydroxymethylpterin diphosphokinase MptE-like protein [Phycisphaerae bacterium]|nr:6-hydroxymethylpterin diphosphokinase MptE-like protein [Phycisphaerae bacterium]